MLHIKKDHTKNNHTIKKVAKRLRKKYLCLESSYELLVGVKHVKH